MDVDEAYEVVGEFGRYQRKLFWGLALMNVFQALHQVHMIFQGATPGFSCRDTPDGPSVDGCPKGTNATCNYVTYDKAFTSIVTEWKLICEDGYKSGVTQSFIMGGIMVGCLIFGKLSDKYGRRPCLTYGVFFFTTFAFISTFARSYWTYTALRFLAGIFNGGAGLVQFVMCMELVGAKWRNFCGNVTPGLFSVGIVVFAGMAYCIRDWRILSLVTALPGIIFIVCFYLYVPESPRWLLTQHRGDEAESVLYKIGKGNGVNMSGTHIRLRPPAAKSGRSYGMIDILTHKLLRQRTLLQMYIWFVNSVVYYGLTMNAGNLGSNIYISVSLSGLVELPAYALSLYVLDRYGRRAPFSIFMIAGGISCLSILVLPTGSDTLAVALALVGKLSISASFSVAYIFTAELYPTVIRNNALGICVTAARFGGVLAPLVIPLDQIYPSLSFVVYGSLSFSAGLLAIRLPETLNQPMPETMEDLSPAASVVNKLTDYKTEDREHLFQNEMLSSKERTRLQ